MIFETHAALLSILIKELPSLSHQISEVDKRILLTKAEAVKEILNGVTTKQDFGTYPRLCGHCGSSYTELEESCGREGFCTHCY